MDEQKKTPEFKGVRELNFEKVKSVVTPWQTNKSNVVPEDLMANTEARSNYNASYGLLKSSPSTSNNGMSA